MLSISKIKYIQSLRLGKFRKQHQQFVAEGSTNVLDFIDSSVRVSEVFATANWIQQFGEKIRGIRCTETKDKELSRISALKSAPEALAIFDIPKHKEINQNDLNGITLMLDDIKDPGNLGTIVRTADWFGIQNIICSKETVDVYNPKVVQATMGSLSRVDVYYENLVEFIETKLKKTSLYAAVIGGKPIDRVSKPKNLVLMIGSEAHGISSKLLGKVDEKISIPSASFSGAESLNASIATAIICYELSKK